MFRKIRKNLPEQLFSVALRPHVPRVVFVPRRFANTNPSKANSVTARRRQPDLVSTVSCAAGSETTHASGDAPLCRPRHGSGFSHGLLHDRGFWLVDTLHRPTKRCRPEENPKWVADGIATQPGEAHSVPLRWLRPATPTTPFIKVPISMKPRPERPHWAEKAERTGKKVPHGIQRYSPLLGSNLLWIDLRKFLGQIWGPDRFLTTLSFVDPRAWIRTTGDRFLNRRLQILAASVTTAALVLDFPAKGCGRLGSSRESVVFMVDCSFRGSLVPSFPQISSPDADPRSP